MRGNGRISEFQLIFAASARHCPPRLGRRRHCRRLVVVVVGVVGARLKLVPWRPFRAVALWLGENVLLINSQHVKFVGWRGAEACVGWRGTLKLKSNGNKKEENRKNYWIQIRSSASWITAKTMTRAARKSDERNKKKEKQKKKHGGRESQSETGVRPHSECKCAGKQSRVCDTLSW